MNILNKIVEDKRKEVQVAKELKPIKRMEQSLFFASPTVSMKQYLNRDDRVGIIAEIKRESPSTGLLHLVPDVEKLSISYMQSGASALSILTDTTYFGGSIKDLEIARKFNYCPILRKDFIIDEYQIIESKSIGADCILLIASCITPKQSFELAALAKSLHLEVLLEVHNKEQIDSHMNVYIDIIGVNNRNLADFKTNIQHSIDLFEALPKALTKISESGIHTATQIKKLKDHGYDGFLIGGHFMKYSEPALKCKELIKEYNSIV